mmetsp:Transcript_31846/g.76345  ORF Transcript_31846/g.76345 Transcript_31846/m.76345 type:complete len:114 (+) Transcript_31846:73-414(+)
MFVTLTKIVLAANPIEYISPYACEKLGSCPGLTCPPPLEATRRGKGCCPVCWAPDHIVSLDRHKAIKSPYTTKTHDNAPASCEGAKCFQLVCPRGEKPGPPPPGGCCASCVVA